MPSPRPNPYRRRLLGTGVALGVLAAGGTLARVRPGTSSFVADFCASPGSAAQALRVPGDGGFLGWLAPRGSPLVLTARSRTNSPTGGDLEYVASHRGRTFANPILVLERGERVRLKLRNALSEPTIVHWHGFTVDSRNDGNGSVLAAPGESYDYDFEVRNRGGLYWYHPHPHGRSAGQTYRGLFGAVVIEDEEERALRAALDLTRGRTDIPLVMQDRRGGRAYTPTPLDLARGLIGDEPYVNGTQRPYLDVATRIYRFRLLNAANARTFRIAFRTSSGSVVPFTMIGNDGGLLAAPVRCEQLFLATAERVDLLVDLRDARVGDVVEMQSLAFDPMYAKVSELTLADDPAMKDHGPAAAASHEYTPHWPEGAPRGLLALRVRKRVAYDCTVPARLSVLPSLDVSNAHERSFRLGFAKGRWRINDRVFAMDAPPIEVQRNTVETWLIRNYHTSMPHAMHLHGFHFEVVSRETSPDELTPLQVDAQGRLATDLGRKDTVLAWPGESVRMAIDFTLPFAGPQSYLFHCHNLEHEDVGMMLPVLVT